MINGVNEGVMGMVQHGDGGHILSTRQYQTLVLALLAVSLIYVLFTLLPGIANLHYLGMRLSQPTPNEIIVQHVERSGAAALAGLRDGDRIASIDGQSISAWHKLYDQQLRTYINDRSKWIERDVLITIERDDKSQTLRIKPLTLSAPQIIHYYGAHVLLILTLSILVIFITMSNPKDRRAFLISLTFVAMISWIGSDTPSWPIFMGMMVFPYSEGAFLLREFCFSLFNQMVIAMLLHLLLIFPSPWLPKPLIRLLVPTCYIASIGVLALHSVLLTAPAIDHLIDTYVFRLKLDTMLLAIAVVMILASYRMQRAAIQKTQARWIVLSLLAVALINLLLWNVPKLVLGVPLIQDYTWIWLSLVLVPLALTGAIANHHIFGIRGIIRRRIEALDGLLARERQLVERRDDHINSLVAEIAQLRGELKAYEEVEQTPSARLMPTQLAKLEQEYPEIRRVREHELLGSSDKWVHVFKDVILAAHGDMPVVIVGESGTGKTAIAQTISRLNGRGDGLYRQISCAQFEHADPAFALGKLFGIGANHGLPNVPREGQPGLLEACDGGALFLDDFDRLPLNVQDLLLYPLEGKAFEPGIGTGSARRVSLKLILATNREPEELVAQGRLQGDVLARMGARVEIPPLRQRVEDIPLLTEHFLESLSSQFDCHIESISPRALHLLAAYPFSQGNVRELYAELRKAVGIASLEKDTVLRAGYLSEAVRDRASASTARVVSAVQVAAIDVALGEARELGVLRKYDFAIKPSEIELGLSHKSKTLTHHLRGLCLQALRSNAWDVAHAAAALAGNDKPHVIDKLSRKMSRTLKTIAERIHDGSESKLYANLPAAYHAALDAAIQHLRQ